MVVGRQLVSFGFGSILEANLGKFRTAKDIVEKEKMIFAVEEDCK